MAVAILFTMYNNTEARQRMAEDVIRWYWSMPALPRGSWSKSCARLPGGRLAAHNLPGGRLRTLLRTNSGALEVGEHVVSWTSSYANDNGRLVEDGAQCWAPRMDLFVVDSGNRGVHPRLVPLSRQVVFKQGDTIRSTTQGELLSLRRAVDVLPLSEYAYVIKLTAKYKLELAPLPPGFDVVGQHIQDHEDGWQNSEFVAIKGARFGEFVGRLSKGPDRVLERKLGDLVRAGDVRFTRLPPQVNHAKYKRANGSYLPRL